VREALVDCRICGRALRPCNLGPHQKRHDADLFWNLVERTDGCWFWRGLRKSDGYGFHGMALAHRAAYEFTYGPVPEGLTLDHLCHNEDLSCRGGSGCIHRLCVRPDHLEAVDAEENTRRGKRSRRFCRNGHERTPDNFYYCKNGRRYCKQCKQQAQKKYRRRLRMASNGSGSTSLT
jgi:hypothetical protein